MTQPYEVLVTAVSERADLFIQTMESMLENLDTPPSRLIVHEDVRPGSRPGEIRLWLNTALAMGKFPAYTLKETEPSRGLGPAMLWCFQQATTPIVFYTQEDWQFVRRVPVGACLDIMEEHKLNHVRFNKRKTMKAKHEDTNHPWKKVEVEFAVPGIALLTLPPQSQMQKFCISDHWYTQASLWRVAPALPGLEACQGFPQANRFVAEFNAWMNRTYGDGREWQEQQHRHERLKTYIWGPVAEPAFIKHLGSVRTTGPIVHKAGA